MEAVEFCGYDVDQIEKIYETLEQSGIEVVNYLENDDFDDDDVSSELEESADLEKYLSDDGVAVDDPVSVKEFIRSVADSSALKLIAYCFEDENTPRRSIKEVLNTYDGTDIVVMIGPEGDFSTEEAQAAMSTGFIPVHLGDSRLRTETAALTATAATYFRYM